MRKAGLACTAAVFYATPAIAGVPTYAVTLPAGSLEDVLYEVSRRSGVNFVFDSPAAAQLQTRGVSGRYTLSGMLNLLVRPAGARFTYLTPQTVLISLADEQKAARSRDTAAPRRRPQGAATKESAPEATPREAEDIVVTATHREEPLDAVPLSVTSYSQGLVDEQGLHDMQALARMTPGMLLRGAWGSSTNLSLRGVYSNTGSATTGVYIDDTPIQTRSLGAGVTSTNVYPSLFDLERVEVLRGPQGALFGSGSLGGTVRFITRAPDFEGRSLSYSTALMATQGGEMGYDANLAMGGMLVEDQISYRVAAHTRRDAGYIDRVDFHDGRVTVQNANQMSSFAVRAAVSAKLNDHLSVTPSLYYQRWQQDDADQSWSIVSNPKAQELRNAARFAQKAEDSFGLATLKVDAPLGSITVQSISSYFHRRRPSVVDYTDYMVEMLTRGRRFALEDVPDYQAHVAFNNDQDVLTQQFKLAGPSDAAIGWVGGVFIQRAQQEAVEYIHEPLLNEALLSMVGLNSADYFGAELLPNGISYVGIDRSIDWQAAVYGQVEVPLTSRLEATLGGRLSWMRYSQTNFQDGPQSGVVPPSLVEHEEMPLLPHASLKWHTRGGAMLYVSASKGARLGGGNAPVSAQRCADQMRAFAIDRVPDHFSSDSLWSFELGSKLAIPALNGALQAAIFHYRWDDIQQSFSLRCLFRFTGNNARARGQGFEITYAMSPPLVPGLSAHMAASVTKAHYARTTSGGVVDEATGERAVVIPNGQALPAPPWRIAGNIRYEWDVNARFAAYVSASGDHSAAYEQGFAAGSVDHNPRTFISPSVTQIRAEVGLEYADWTLSAFVENMLNSGDVLQYSSNNRNSINMRSVILRPRTFGLKLAVGF